MLIGDNELDLKPLALIPLIALSLHAQAPAPAFQLRAADFAQTGTSVSTIAWRADGEGGLDVTPTPCEGRYVLAFSDRRPVPFNISSVHTFLHQVELFGYVFDSDNLDPLVFRVDREGYTWVKGKGSVQVPADSPEAIVLARGVNRLSDNRTFLLPPGTRELAPSHIPEPTLGQAIGVCGNQLQILSLTRTPETVTLQLRVSNAPATGRINLALLDDKGHRYKPTDPELTWANVTRATGIQIPMATSPGFLEFEGQQISLQALTQGAAPPQP